MAITSVTKLWDAQSCDIDSTGRTFTVGYLIQTDSIEDQTMAIIEANVLPTLGTVFNFDVSEKDGGAVCSKINISRYKADDTRTTWVATLTYQTYVAGWPQGFNLENENDPLTWHDEISVDFSQDTEVVEKAIYMRGFTGKMKTMFPDNVNPAPEDWITKAMIPINSAADVFDPPLVKEVDIMHVRITRYLPEFPAVDITRYQGYINSDQFVISKPNYLFELTVFPYTAKLNWEADFQFHEKSGIRYWKVTADLAVKLGTWHDDVLDRGLHKRAFVGDNKSQNTPVREEDIYVEDTNGRWVKKAPKEKIKTPDDEDVRDVVLLDGDGAPLDEEKIKSKEFIFLRYMKYFSRPFAAIDWGS